MRDSLGIEGGGIDLIEIDPIGRVGVIKTFEPEIQFGFGDSSLVPQGLAGGSRHPDGLNRLERGLGGGGR